jgi:transcriptional regulator with XRE-family HTH domain
MLGRHRVTLPAVPRPITNKPHGTLGRLVAKVMAEKGWTSFEEFAEHASVSANAISKYHSGLTAPDEDTLLAWEQSEQLRDYVPAFRDALVDRDEEKRRARRARATQAAATSAYVPELVDALRPIEADPATQRYLAQLLDKIAAFDWRVGIGTALGAVGTEAARAEERSKRPEEPKPRHAPKDAGHGTASNPRGEP